MIKAVLFSLLVASALSMTLKKRGGDMDGPGGPRPPLTHEKFAAGIADAKGEFLGLSDELAGLNGLASDANDAAATGDYSKWEEIEHKMKDDLEEHKDRFLKEEEKLLKFAEALYMGNSDFQASGTCDAVHNAAEPLREGGSGNVDPQVALLAIEQDLECFAELAGGAREIPVVPARGSPGDFSDEHAFELTLSILSEVYKVRHAGDRFEQGARLLDAYFATLRGPATRDAAEDLQTKRLVSLLRRVLKTMRK